MRPPTLDDACAHRLDMPRTKTAEEPAHAPPSVTPPHSPPRLPAFMATTKWAELRADTSSLCTQVHGTSPSTSLAARTRGS